MKMVAFHYGKRRLVYFHKRRKGRKEKIFIRTWRSWRSFDIAQDMLGGRNIRILAWIIRGEAEIECNPSGAQAIGLCL
jgi:hypothetical protein